MPQFIHSMLKSKHLDHISEDEDIDLFSYIDLLNYMLKYKIPQIVTLILNPSGFYVDPFLRPL